MNSNNFIEFLDRQIYEIRQARDSFNHAEAKLNLDKIIYRLRQRKARVLDQIDEELCGESNRDGGNVYDR